MNAFIMQLALFMAIVCVQATGATKPDKSPVELRVGNKFAFREGPNEQEARKQRQVDQPCYEGSGGNCPDTEPSVGPVCQRNGGLCRLASDCGPTVTKPDPLDCNQLNGEVCCTLVY